MKKLIYASLTVLSLCVVSSCKKDNDPAPTTTTTTACNGKNLCFKLDGTEVSQDAKWKEISTTRWRLYWEETSGANYKNIEIDMYGNAVGSYPVKANPGAGEGGFQYYIKDGSSTKNISGESGTIEITSIANNTISGKFTLTAKDAGGTTYQVTEGNFVNVPK